MSKRFAQSNDGSKIPAKKPVQVPDEYKIILKVLNPHITCPICKGYFVEAITITECLHTFCKSCLLKHFEEDNCCPKCTNLIHQSHPSHYVSFDRTMQELVYKLVPGLQVAEEERRNAFAQSTAGATGVVKKEPEVILIAHFSILFAKDESETDAECGEEVMKNHHRSDDQVIIQLCTDETSEMDNAELSFVRLSGKALLLIFLALLHQLVKEKMATVNTLKRYLALAVLGDMARYQEVDIFCNNELMGRDFSMKFIEKTRWRNKPKDLPLQLYFRKHVEF
uniref:RING-type domain-containing protein n=1 Tax=Syphacia muris TaxID=451379 RepID=A0A0N5AXM6_9BILA